MSSNERAPRRHPRRAFAFGPLCVASAMVAAVASCAHAQTETARDIAGTDTVHLTIATDNDQYSRGEPIDIRLTVTNGTDRAVTLQFTSGQRYDIIIRDGNREVWRWGLTRGFVQMLSSETLEPGETKNYSAVYAGDLLAGTYTVVGVLTSRNYPLEARTSFTVR